MANNPDISVIALDDVSWTPIRPSRDCLSMSLINPLGTDLLFRSLDTNPFSELTIPSLVEWEVYRSIRNTILQQGAIIGYGRLLLSVGNIKTICRY